jgi:hypothetical protein
MTIYAQDDIILIAVTDVEPKPEQIATPADAVVVLAQGEHSGHQHAFYGGTLLFRDDALA